MVLRDAAGLVVDSLNYGGLVDPWASEGYHGGSGAGQSGCRVTSPGVAGGFGPAANAAVTTNLRPDSEQILNKLLTLLQKQPDWTLVVAGHTDNTGSDATNLPLSRQRADAVVGWLVAKGIPKSRLVPAGFGATRPIADNATDDGKAKNRRVDLVKVY